MKEDYIKNHFFAVDSFFSPSRNTSLTMLPSLIYADIINQQEILTFQTLRESGEESLWAQNLQQFFACLLKCCREPYEVLISLAVGKLFGPGFAEVSSTSNPRGCHYAHVQQRQFKFPSLPLDICFLPQGWGWNKLTSVCLQQTWEQPCECGVQISLFT